MANEMENGVSEENKDQQTEKGLSVSSWEPQKKPSPLPGGYHTMPPDSAANSPRRNNNAMDSKKKALTYEEILQQLSDKIKSLIKREDFTTADCRPDLKFIQRQSRYSPDVVIHRRLTDHIVKLGIAHVYMNVWKSVSNIDYLRRSGDHCSPAFKNLQTIISIVWNCTDKSTMLCECLVKCSVVQLAVTELTSEKLAGSDLSDENVLYLVKAYLGLLHNIVRLCPDSRKIFRTAGAIKILQNYVASPNLLVKAKSFLILSYLINEEENDLINATDDNLAFLIRILQEALASENHFAQTCAFWAYELADGLNHLAVNDGNKVKMGRLGALTLYIKLLQSENQEEQNLGTSGLWILAFKDENKQLLKEEPGCMEALRSLAMNGSQESIRRAARGALWVVKSVPDRPVIKTVDEEAIPHIMISYHHKSAQRTMVKVKNRLRAAGYKVWMDVDNMFGSTLESMALAVEKAGIILVCMTQGYKDSPSCRTEAEYTYRLKKEVIPLVLQPGYDPDGWLGALVGTRLHYDFSTDDLIPTEMPKLIRELGHRGKLPRQSAFAQRELCSSLDGISSIRSDTPSLCTGPSLAPSEGQSLRSMHSYTTDPSAAGAASPSILTTWGTESVVAWLHGNELGEVAHLFDRFTGDLILQLQRMMRRAPEHYYHTLESQLKFDLLVTLKFTKALESLR